MQEKEGQGISHCGASQGRNGEREGQRLKKERWEGIVYVEVGKGEETFFLCFPVHNPPHPFFINRNYPSTVWANHLVNKSLSCISMTVLQFSCCHIPLLLRPAVSLSPCTWTRRVLFLLPVLPLRWPPSTQERDTACRSVGGGGKRGRERNADGGGDAL